MCVDETSVRVPVCLTIVCMYVHVMRYLPGACVRTKLYSIYLAKWSFSTFSSFEERVVRAMSSRSFSNCTESELCK